MDARLTRQDWIDHGLRTLSTEGANGLKVGAMAANQNVSRGSFYWHFRDFADFRSAILQCWRDRTVDQIVREFDDDPTASRRLLTLVMRAFYGKRGLDRAIRIWASNDPAVATMVAGVDSSRVEYMAKLMIDGGVSPDDARARAAFIYWAYLGQAIVTDPASAVIDKLAFERIAGLFETQT